MEKHMSDEQDRFFQTGWVVPDIDAGMRSWLAVKGVGPFYVRRGMSPASIEHLGEKAELTVNIAIARAGDFMLELIEQVSEGPSAYRDVYAAGSGGFHHLGAYTDDFDGTVERHREAGVPIAAYGQAGVARFAYFDTRSSVGCMTEVMERSTSTSLIEYFAEITAASVDWDGSDPIREDS
jgi:methylmalonyl-CoA/ethylmalonyl-CoA epimerase